MSDAPPPVLLTPHLRLRPLAAEDAPDIAAALAVWQVSRWLTSPPFPYTPADAETFVGRVCGPYWAITTGADAPLIGVVSIKPDLGYWLSPAYHGRGLMSEAVAAVTAWYFGQTAEALISGHIVGNTASRRLLLTAGFIDTHIERTSSRPLNTDVPVQRMILTHTAHAQRRAAL